MTKTIEELRAGDSLRPTESGLRSRSQVAEHTGLLGVHAVAQPGIMVLSSGDLERGQISHDVEGRTLGKRTLKPATLTLANTLSRRLEIADWHSPQERSRQKPENM